MPPLPAISWSEAVKCFEKIGYSVARQRGSHLRLINHDPHKKPLTIPRHPELGKGLLRKLIRDAEIAVDEFVGLR